MAATPRTLNLKTFVTELGGVLVYRMYCTQHLHGTTAAAEQGLRGRALIRDSGLRSPAERPNGMQYRPEVLQNLLISASLGGYRILPRRA